jgi:predicted DNA-binding protein (MmcQ/YjbR family)
MPHTRMFDEDDPTLARLRHLALAFPDAAEKMSHGRPTFFTTKVFAYYGGSVKRAGGHEQHDTAAIVLLDEHEREAVLATPRFFVPAYLGPYGWVGVDLDEAADWDEVGELLDTSYRLTAGPQRVAALDAGQRARPARPPVRSRRTTISPPSSTSPVGTKPSRR